MSMSDEDQNKQIRDRRNEPMVEAPVLAIITKLRMHILSLLQEGEIAGLVSDVNTFQVPGGIGCSGKVRGGSSIVAHFVGQVSPDGTAPIWVWNSPDEISPKGKPIAGKLTYGIEVTAEATKKNQRDLLQFVKDWIETGKPGTWKTVHLPR